LKIDNLLTRLTAPTSYLFLSLPILSINSRLNRIAQIVELAGNAYRAYQAGSPDRKRELLKLVRSNLTVSGRKVDVTMDFPFSEIANRAQISRCGPKENRTPVSAMRMPRSATEP
jgi:hypothetical protein